MKANDEEQKRIFSKNLLKYVRRHGGSQTEIAKNLGVSQQTFNNWCRGKSMQRMGEIQEIAAFFNINHTFLIEEDAEASDSLIKKYINRILATPNYQEHIPYLMTYWEQLTEDQRKAIDSTIAAMDPDRKKQKAPQFKIIIGGVK